MVGIREIPHDLVERVESGTGADRELEGRVWCALGGLEFVMWDGAGCVYRGSDGIGHIDRVHIRPWSSSLDAVVSLIEQKLPGWEWLKHEPGRMWLAMKPIGYRTKTHGAGSSDCRALLAACLRAIQAQARTLADAHSKNPPEAEHG